MRSGNGVRRSVSIALALVFLLVTAAQAAEFWASRKSNKYHYPSCQWAQKIKPQNLIVFSSPEEAIRAGYVPCKVCRPPVSSRAELDKDNKHNLMKKTLQFAAGD
ncbi:MAG: Ada metal-binding domain-containing protein [Nitrospirota bacterium]